MRLKDFEEKVMDLKIIGLRILSFRIYHNHVRSCLARVYQRQLLIWDDEGQCYEHMLPMEEKDLDDDEVTERFNYTSVGCWCRVLDYDI
jgi:hypothetical protein